MKRFLRFAVLTALLLASACAQAPQPAAPAAPSPLPPTPTETASPTLPPTATATPAPTATVTPTITPTATPVGGSPVTIAYTNLPLLRPGAWRAVQSASFNLYQPGEPGIQTLMPIDDATQAVIRMKEGNWADQFIRLSPDRLSAAYTLTGVESNEIGRIDLETLHNETLHTLPIQAAVEHLEWSPDGQWLAVTYYPDPSPRMAADFISADGKKMVRTACSSVEAWGEQPGSVYCKKGTSNSVIYLLDLPTQTEQSIPWQSGRLFTLAHANFDYAQLFPALDAVLLADVDHHALYWGKNMHLLIGKAVTNSTVREFVDGMVKIADFHDADPLVMGAQLSPDGSSLMFWGINSRGLGYTQGIDALSFTHVYAFGSEPLDLPEPALVNHLWGLDWSPDSSSILALKGARLSREDPPLFKQLDANLVIVDAKTLEITWTMEGDPNQVDILENVFMINDKLANFDAGW